MRSALWLVVACGVAEAFNAPTALAPSRRMARGAAARRSDGLLALRAQQTAPAFPDLSVLTKVAGRLGETLQFAAADPVRARYSTAMIARFSYFLGQGVTVALAGINEGSLKREVVDERVSQAATRALDPAAVIGALTDAILAEDTVPLENAGMDEKPLLGNDEQRELFNKNFQSIVGVLKRDMQNIENGKYAFPYDLELGYAPQWSPVPVLNKLNIYLDERVKTIDRMYKKDGFEVRRNFKAGEGKYPSYYLQNFHYQSDGWLSARSAEIYDYQVESLFLGTADAMRRQVLPHLTEHIQSLKKAGTPEADIKVLDVATGTGRFASFIMQNFADLRLDALDLSPFYLAEAKKLLNKYPGVTYVEAPAEAVPAAEEQYDMITCVYLFHELPEPVRSKVVKEWFRVLKPGGKIFFVDSAQQGEVPYDRVLDGFTIIAHEPYYKNYTQQDLVKLFTDAGFEVDTSEVHWVSKCMVVSKPLEQPAPVAEQEAEAVTPELA